VGGEGGVIRQSNQPPGDGFRDGTSTAISVLAAFVDGARVNRGGIDKFAPHGRANGLALPVVSQQYGKEMIVVASARAFARQHDVFGAFQAVEEPQAIGSLLLDSLRKAQSLPACDGGVGRLDGNQVEARLEKRP